VTTVVLFAIGAVLATFLVSIFMWWATKRSALFAMAAGALLALVGLAAIVVVAWFISRAVSGP
jgi:hypothetical protein